MPILDLLAEQSSREPGLLWRHGRLRRDHRKPVPRRESRALHGGYDGFGGVYMSVSVFMIFSVIHTYICMYISTSMIYMREDMVVTRNIFHGSHGLPVYPFGRH